MGIFTLLMIASMGIYFDEDTFASVGVGFLILIIAVYIIPLFLHMKTLSVADFLKGIVYLLFMTPTYINIMAVYAVSNIHDVSWGSRPAGAVSSAVSKKEANMSAEYQDFRSRFLIIWIVANNAAGFIVVVLSRGDQNFYLFLIGAVLFTTIGIKFFFSVLHVLMSMYSDWALGSFMKKSEKKGKEYKIKEYNSPEYQRLLKEFTPFEYRRQATTRVKAVVDKAGENKQIMLEENLLQKAVSKLREPPKNGPRLISANKSAAKDKNENGGIPKINNLTNIKPSSNNYSEESKNEDSKQEISVLSDSDAIKEDTFEEIPDSEGDRQINAPDKRQVLVNSLTNTESERSKPSPRTKPDLRVRGYSSDGNSLFLNPYRK